MASSAIWATACPSISRRWTGLARRFITVARSRRWPRATALVSRRRTIVFRSNCRASMVPISLPLASRNQVAPARMLYVSIFVELLRARPALVVWCAALLQAAIWTLVPALFYLAPPGDLPTVLAVGHELQLGTDFGPPLAFWLAEVAFVIAGGHVFGVYLLSQVCVVIAYWAVFTLGRSIVGAHHAALAVLLMAGIAAFTLPTPEFGPAILAMPLWAIVLLHYWRAVGEQQRGYWLALAVEIGLLLLT